MKFDITKIDEDEPLPSNEDFAEPFDIEDEEEPDCFFCAGSGEGYTPDSRCAYCNGRGTIKKRKY